ncbi:hypothetical protein Tco_0211232 [Tanacetum coccineum]
MPVLTHLLISHQCIYQRSDLWRTLRRMMRRFLRGDPEGPILLTEETGMLRSHTFAYRVIRLGCISAPGGGATPFLSEEVAERLLALPTPPPSPLSPYSSPLPQIPSPPLPISSPPPNSPTYVEGSLGSRAAGIRHREMHLPSPVGESSAGDAARQVGPTTVVVEADLYGFADMLDAAPGRQTSRELGYGITDTWDDLVGAIQEIAPTTLEGVNQRVTEDRPFHRRTALLMEEEARLYLSRVAWRLRSMACLHQVHSEGHIFGTTVMAQHVRDHLSCGIRRRRQSVLQDLLKAGLSETEKLRGGTKDSESLKDSVVERAFRDSRGDC